MTIKRSLGRGLSELLSSVSLPEITPIRHDVPREIAIEYLQPGKYQPRKDMNPEALQELADSIRIQGILQPLLVRPLSKNHYEIIAGERRWRAAQLAQQEKVPVYVREITDEAAIAMGLIENIQREDLNALEQAEALKRLVDEFALTHEEVAKAVGKSRVSITNLLRLLHLSPQVKTLLRTGELEMGHAKAILTLDSALQWQTAQWIVAKSLSVRATEDLVRKLQQAENKPKVVIRRDPDIVKLQSELSDKLGAQVKIRHSAKGKGQLVIHYFSLDELEGVLKHIRG
jgi:ParB family transcriptional regulator, chromosome partitioning protein